MRIAIREQLALLVIFAVLLALAIVSIPTWIFVHNFVIDVETDGLALTASLKASRVASELNLIQTICQTIATRILLQHALVDYYNGNATDPFSSAQSDLESAMNSGRLTGIFQARLYSRNATGEQFGLLNVTGSQVGNQASNIQLPYLTPDGKNVNLSDTEFGYPPPLYPNITYLELGYPNPYEPSTPAVGAYAFPGVALSTNGGLVLGPLPINESFALISLTIPIRSLSVQNFIIGYLTLIASTSSLIDVQTSREGLDNTGIVLLIGPDNPSSRFNTSLPPSNATYSPPKKEFADSAVRFILPPVAVPGQANRHSMRQYGVGNFANRFNVSQYPGLLDIYTDKTNNSVRSIARWSATNEQGVPVSVGVSRPQTTLVDWVVVVEKARSETNQPIHTLRNILLGCVFGTAGLAVLLVFPCAHLGVKPITRLKTATEKSIPPPGYDHELSDYFDEDDMVSSGGNTARSKWGVVSYLRHKIESWRKARNPSTSDPSESQFRSFRIPGHVKMGKHYVTDELTELSHTFNEMTDELLRQYTSLDEKVAERTRELEISKRAAEAANESKTLFIANISHELKTPLNGIMGMCAVCMEENDINRIKQSLTTLYRSGDLLLHLLEDLLSFSKNQIGQQVNIEEREFCLGDIKSQVVSIFDKQVRENNVNFTVSFVNSDLVTENDDVNQKGPDGIGSTRGGPPGIGRLSDIYFWGDQHRILQVIINLVGNSLKFTPADGKVQLRIRCLGEIERPGDESRTSSFSKSSSMQHRTGRSRASGSIQSMTSRSATNASAAILNNGTALTINPLDPKATPHIHVRERSPTPPPINAKSYAFEFQVEDSGPGIPDHMQDKIFEPFVQGDLGLSKRFGGTGLGLSICSQLANLMGGSITLESTVGVGSIFTVQIPLRYVKERVPSSASSIAALRPSSVASTSGVHAADTIGGMAAPTHTQAGSSGVKTLNDNAPRLVGLSAPFFVANSERTKDLPRLSYNPSADGLEKFRVLVADDNSTNVEVVSRMLKLEDISDVTVAKDGQEAYDLVKQSMDKNQSFDVIFMDVQMPNVDGLQSTRLIRKIGYRAPIVALTAFSEESNVKECIESGMNEFLSKPIRRPALKQILKKFATIAEEPETTTTTTTTTTNTNGDVTGSTRPNGVD